MAYLEAESMLSNHIESERLEALQSLLPQQTMQEGEYCPEESTVQVHSAYQKRKH